MTVPQILVQTSPVALTIQVEEPEYVPAEVAELGNDTLGKIPPDAHQQLLRCDARLDIMSATPNQPEITETAIVAVAQTDLTVESDDAETVVRALAMLCDGFVNDLVAGRLLCPGSQVWIPY